MTYPAWPRGSNIPYGEHGVVPSSPKEYSFRFRVGQTFLILTKFIETTTLYLQISLL